jgi:hypothetical protein
MSKPDSSFWNFVAFSGIILGMMYFILNFTVAPMKQDIKDMQAKITGIEQRINSIETGIMTIGLVMKNNGHSNFTAMQVDSLYNLMLKKLNKEDVQK